MFFKMNMGIVLLDFSLIFKIFCKSLVNKKNSRLKTKRSHFWPVPPEIYFQDWKSSECKLILKMVPQSIYWKQCLCQHLPAFLGDRGGNVPGGRCRGSRMEGGPCGSRGTSRKGWHWDGSKDGGILQRSNQRAIFHPILTLLQAPFLNYAQRAQRSGCQWYLFSAQSPPSTGNRRGHFS